MQDDWFPTIARIRTVAAECREDRMRRRRMTTPDVFVTPLVCPYCHGARFVRLSGPVDPIKVHAGDPGSSTQPCPKCTTDGAWDGHRERGVIADEGGVPNAEYERHIDMDAQQWPHQLAAMRDPLTGRIDMDALYRLSRELRGLDPNVDARPRAVSGFSTIGSRAAFDLTAEQGAA